MNSQTWTGFKMSKKVRVVDSIYKAQDALDVVEKLARDLELWSYIGGQVNEAVNSLNDALTELEKVDDQ
jgi:hypothetical protein